MTTAKSASRKPRLTDKVLDGAMTALGAAEAGPGESSRTEYDFEAINAALAWVRGMRRYRKLKQAERLADSGGALDSGDRCEGRVLA